MLFVSEVLERSFNDRRLSGQLQICKVRDLWNGPGFPINLAKHVGKSYSIACTRNANTVSPQLHLILHTSTPEIYGHHFSYICLCSNRFHPGDLCNNNQWQKIFTAIRFQPGRRWHLAMAIQQFRHLQFRRAGYDPALLTPRAQLRLASRTQQQFASGRFRWRRAPWRF